MLMFRIVVAAFLLAALARPSFAHVTGTATVIDGDTIVVAGERVRLEGIDAPELHQTCTAYGQEWACGPTSAEWLKERLHGRQVECIGHARDRFGRLLAVCYAGGESIKTGSFARAGRSPSALLGGLRAGGIGGQARRRRDLARRVYAALGVAR
jgi:endonuclease YncB( thermonuclease family)